MKFKKIPNDYFITILDRLSRFEPAFIRYKRVFDDIINKFAIGIKLKDLSIDDEISLVEEIFNSSVKINNDFRINSIILSLEETYFNFNQVSYQYLSSRINISAMLAEIRNDVNLPKNINWLNYLNKNKDIYSLRYEKSLLYPIEKILLCEGETERILLPVIMELLDVDFDKLGILLIPAGGKNQVARKYYSMIEYVNLPFYILLDKDATPTKNLIENKIRPSDSIYLINCGEFEDLIPINILSDTINFIHTNDEHCSCKDFSEYLSNVNNIENIFKKYGFGEFKKAHFALSLKSYIEKNCTINDFSNSEFIKIAEFLKTNTYNQSQNQ